MLEFFFKANDIDNLEKRKAILLSTSRPATCVEFVLCFELWVMLISSNFIQFYFIVMSCYSYHAACFSFWSKSWRIALAVDLERSWIEGNTDSRREIGSGWFCSSLTNRRLGRPQESSSFFLISEFFSILSCFCKDVKSDLPSLQFLELPSCSISIPSKGCNLEKNTYSFL